MYIFLHGISRLLSILHMNSDACIGFAADGPVGSNSTIALPSSSKVTPLLIRCAWQILLSCRSNLCSVTCGWPQKGLAVITRGLVFLLLRKSSRVTFPLMTASPAILTLSFGLHIYCTSILICITIGTCSMTALSACIR